MSTSSKIKSDVDQLDDLVKDLLTEVNRPIDNNNTNTNSYYNSGPIHRYSYQRQTNNDLNTPQQTKTTREERIRIKRGNPTDIPTETSSSSMTTTTKTTTANNKSEMPTASIDEHLIDSLLESVQNTLKKRAERNQSNWSTDIPISNRRTYSSSATYNDSVHRVSLLNFHFV